MGEGASVVMSVIIFCWFGFCLEPTWEDEYKIQNCSRLSCLGSCLTAHEWFSQWLPEMQCFCTGVTHLRMRGASLPLYTNVWKDITKPSLIPRPWHPRSWILMLDSGSSWQQWSLWGVAQVTLRGQSARSVRRWTYQHRLVQQFSNVQTLELLPILKSD
jgi:hypothetical protein